jgi:glutamate/tyrosine decarboxylase-like PLP-dependent enzyme
VDRIAAPGVAPANAETVIAGGTMGAQLPEKGVPRDEIFASMREMKTRDADWQGGRTWSLIYPAGEEVDDVLREANNLYMFENALNPFRFPSLRRMEADVVSMTVNLLHGDEESGGTMTSGGTESILMAVKTARDRGREEKGITRPEMVVPVSAHPAFAKAAKYLCLDMKQIPLRDDLRADPEAAARLLTENTVLVVGSAPNYPHGVIDPIPELAALAAERNISFHTDACVGGFLLPFLERLGHPVPPFDFRVPGVTTMSADVHKYGFCTKGASVIAHRSQATLQYQMFLYDEWPGGLYGSPAMAGARAAAPIAAAWAVMRYLGQEGYQRLAQRTIETARKLRAGIEAIPQLHVFGDPPASLLAFGSSEIDVMAVGDVMDDRGWHLDRQKNPDALHMMVSPTHARVADRFLSDLREAVAHHGESRGVEARYS